MDIPELIPIELIDPNPYQPRQAEDLAAIAEIAASIRKNGLMQVPSARRVNGRVQLAFGHTRLASFKLNGEPAMPLIIRDLDDLQMFELGVSENIKRRDLNPIEEAEAMRRYMQDFQKTSVEAAEFFNCSPEKIRSAVRLLNLPQDLRHQVADGTITQNNARRLLTIQRVAPDKLKTVVNELDRRDVDPDKVIGETLTDSSTTVKMWERWQSGDPLAGSRLWKIYAPGDSFPKEHLPELKAGDAARALEIERDEALEKLYIPALRDGCWMGVDGIKEYPTPGMTAAEYLVSRGAPVDVIERLAHLLNPPGCSACPFYAKVEGNHYCTFKPCYNRKVRAYEENVITKASKRLGIAIYSKREDGDCAYLSNYDEPDKKLFQEKHADLRLKKGQNWNNRFEAVPEGYSVVVVGETLKAMRKSKKSNSNSYDRSMSDNYYKEQKRLAQLRDANENALYSFLWNVATPVFLQVFANAEGMEFYKFMADRIVSGVPAKEPSIKATKKERLEFYQRSILFQLLNVELWDYKTDEHNRAVRRLAKRLETQAKTWGVKLPKDWTERATEADKAITVTTVTEEAKA